MASSQKNDSAQKKGKVFLKVAVHPSSAEGKKRGRPPGSKNQANKAKGENIPLCEWAFPQKRGRQAPARYTKDYAAFPGMLTETSSKSNNLSHNSAFSGSGRSSGSSSSSIRSSSDESSSKSDRAFEQLSRWECCPPCRMCSAESTWTSPILHKIGMCFLYAEEEARV